jgi:hypothetical protein
MDLVALILPLFRSCLTCGSIDVLCGPVAIDAHRDENDFMFTVPSGTIHHVLRRRQNELSRYYRDRTIATVPAHAAAASSDAAEMGGFAFAAERQLAKVAWPGTCERVPEACCDPAVATISELFGRIASPARLLYARGQMRRFGIPGRSLHLRIRRLLLVQARHRASPQPRPDTAEQLI